MYREPRIQTRCRVEFTRLETRIVAESEDLSERGVFVRTDHMLPVGAVVALEIALPGGVQLKVVSRVAHRLSPAAARVLGREPGIGFQFLEHDNDGRTRLSSYLASLATSAEPMPVPQPPIEHCRVVVADPSPALLDRVAAAMTAAGFEVAVARHGGEAYAECQDTLPDILVCDLDLPVMDGLTLIKQLAQRPELSRIAVVFTSEDAAEMTRLHAYRAGVRDFIPKPFTDEELCIRLRRIAIEVQSSARRVLRGELAEIPLATLLSLLSFERKSGVLVLRPGDQAARLFVADGRIVRVEGGPVEAGTSARRRLLSILDWEAGGFEFSGCEVVGTDEVGVGTEHLLLEHARVRDHERAEVHHYEDVEL